VEKKSPQKEGTLAKLTPDWFIHWRFDRLMGPQGSWERSKEKGFPEEEKFVRVEPPAQGQNERCRGPEGGGFKTSRLGVVADEKEENHLYRGPPLYRKAVK